MQLRRAVGDLGERHSGERALVVLQRMNGGTGSDTPPQVRDDRGLTNLPRFLLKTSIGGMLEGERYPRLQGEWPLKLKQQRSATLGEAAKREGPSGCASGWK